MQLSIKITCCGKIIQSKVKVYIQDETKTKLHAIVHKDKALWKNYKK